MGKVHVPGRVCPGCEKKLEEADPRLAAWFHDYVKPQFPDAHISCAWRGQLDQDRAYLEGKSRLKFPKSKHNRISDGKPASLALDLFRLLPDGKAEFPPGFYFQIAEVVRENKVPIEWGGDWRAKGFTDMPHFEIKTG